MKKVLFLAYYFPPMGGAGVQRAQKFVQYLPSEGFLPVVVAGPSSEDQWTPHDQTFAAAISSSVSVHRVRGPVPNSTSKLRRRLSRWLGLPDDFSKWWISSGVDLACKAANGAELILATMPPFPTAEVAHLVSLRFGIPWVADLRDPWALDEIQLYPSGLHRRLDLSRMERLLSSASLIVMNTLEAAARLKRASSRISPKKILTIPNGFDQEDFSGEIAPRRDPKFRVVHAGTMLTSTGLQLRGRRFYRILEGVDGRVDVFTRSPGILLEAIKDWCEARPDVRSDLEIVFAGRTSAEDRTLIDRIKMPDVIRYAGYLSHPDSLELIRTADLLFLPMHNVAPGKRSSTTPAKTFEYMASGRPILAAVPEGDARDALSQCGTALICGPDDKMGMIEILNKVYSAWKVGESIVTSTKSYLKQFDRRHLTRELAIGFEAVLAKRAVRDRSDQIVEFLEARSTGFLAGKEVP